MDIWFNGGIGDFLAVESHLTDEERSQIENIKLCCYQVNEIVTILERIKPNYPNLKTFDNVSNQTNELISDLKIDNFKSMEIWRNHMIAIKNQEFAVNQHIVDYSIDIIFPQILNDNRRFNRSSLHSFFSKPIGLPNDYYVICPHSNKSVSNRNFSESDWDFVIRHLEKVNRQAIVIAIDYSEVPKYDLLNSMKGIGIIECLEIISGCSGFIGIDSFGATFAAQIPLDFFLVKCINDNTWIKNKLAYFAPRNQFGFLRRRLGEVKLL